MLHFKSIFATLLSISFAVSFSLVFISLEMSMAVRVYANTTALSEQKEGLGNSKVIHKLSTSYPQGIGQTTQLNKNSTNPAKVAMEELKKIETITSKPLKLAKTPKTVKPKTTNQNQAPKPIARFEGNLEALIQESCHQNGCNGEQLTRVMYCESGGRSNATNGIHKGIFQFNPNTFNANSKRAGLEGADIWNAEHQVKVASWMFGNGQAHQWSCK